MNDDTNPEDEAMARLRAADPAAGVEPVSGFVERVVADTSAESPTPVADLSAERERRRPRWLAVAAVAASLLVVGGAGGYGIAALGADRGGTTAAAPPISLSEGSNAADGSGVADSAGGPTEQGATVDPATGSTSDSVMPGWGRNHFTSSDLSTQATSAAGYAFDPAAASNVDTIRGLAQALGVEGEPQLIDGAWSVGPQDGTSTSLWVSLDGTLSFWYSNPAGSPWACPSDGAECTPVGDIPSEEAAIDALRSIMAAAGQDVNGFEYDSVTWEGATSRTAQAWRLVDGQRADAAWSLELSASGISSVSGGLAPLVSLGDYPVVSAAEAFERLSDPRFGTQPVGPFYVTNASETETWTPPTAPPTTPVAGSSIVWPVTDVHIVDARLGLATQMQPDGSTVLVPAYEFTDSDGGGWSVIAVADEALAFSAE
ncbi:hypothetical protein [Microbacterium sp. ZW T5_56]|uniref:hypothetical protein n=1 Tax=Microbacterium sp. ZW T5_56 TaxID=3378081 RepID=UPI0038552443